MPKSHRACKAPTNTPTFVPRRELEPKSWRRRVYKIDFAEETRRSIADALKDVSGTDGMSFFALVNDAMNTIREEHELISTHIDDAYVYLCEQLGVNINQFPKLMKQEPAGFLPYAKVELSCFGMPKSEVQWTVQSDAYWKCWKRWTTLQCEQRGGCGSDDHHDCDEIYIRPDFWALAQALDGDRRDKEKLLASIEATPSRRARSVAGAALARISVASRQARP